MEDKQEEKTVEFFRRNTESILCWTLLFRKEDYSMFMLCASKELRLIEKKSY